MSLAVDLETIGSMDDIYRATLCKRSICCRCVSICLSPVSVILKWLNLASITDSRVEVNISLAFLCWIGIALHP